MNFRLALLVATALSSAPAFAQTAEQGSGTEADTGVGEIIVTAQRRSENLQNVPVAVSAVTSGELSRTGVSGITDLKLSVPTLNLTSSNGYLTSSLRGIGSNGVGVGIENPIAVYIDGVYYGSQAGSLLSLNNVQQIEVLKGPQGTLFGRNATGGLIQITTRTPSDKPQVDLNVSYGNYNTITANGYAGGALSDKFAADIAVHYEHQGDGWGRNLTANTDIGKVDHDFAIRSKWVFTPSDTTKFTLIGDYSDQRSTVNAFRTIPGTVNGFAPFLGVQPDRGYDTASDFVSYTDSWSGGGSLRWDQEIGSVNLATITAYRKSRSDINFDFDGIQFPIAQINVRHLDQQFSQELQLTSSSSGRFTWVMGAYFLDAKARYAPFTLNIGGAPFLTVNNGQRSQSIAGYAQGTYEIADDTHLTLGGRYTSEKRSTIDRQLVGVPTGGVLVTIPEQSITFDKFTFRASLDHRFSSEVMAYMSFNRGFKSGGYNSGLPGTAPFKPETLDAFEAGLKTDLLDRRLRINLAGFYYTYNDVQVQQLGPGAIFVINGAKARDYGLDVDLVAQVSDGFRISGGFGWISPTFRSFPACPISTPTGGGTTTVGSCAGNQLPLASKFTGNIAADFTTEVGSGTLDLNANLYYNSGFFTESDNVIRQDAYATLGASAKYTFSNGISIGVYGKNLTNKRVINFQTTIASDASIGTGDTHTGFYQAPRTYGVTIGFKY